LFGYQELAGAKHGSGDVLRQPGSAGGGDLNDKPHVATPTWMARIAADHIPGFDPSSVEHLARARPFESQHL
jgi:hypothetical protein